MMPHALINGCCFIKGGFPIHLRKVIEASQDREKTKDGETNDRSQQELP
jgi:hypothetical protein